jgi:benzylsuccinate CoA-transferase BbsF subunit
MASLTGIRIIDFCSAAAGPFLTMLAGFMGAEVIKIESMQRLDVSRYIRSSNRETDVNGGAVFNEINLGKRSINLNLSNPKGIDLAKRLIKMSDIVVENMRPGVMKKFGLDYDSLVKIKADIIMLSYSLSGQTGTEAHYRGYASTVGVLSGLSYLSGFPDDPPNRVGDEIDAITGAAALIPVISALRYRQKTGKGQYIDFSSRESGISFIGDALMDYAMNSRDQMRCANHDDIRVPNNCYRCLGEDRWISISISTDDEWERFCNATEHPEWLIDPRFCDIYRRMTNEKELDRLIEQWTTNKTDYEVMQQLQKSGVAAIPSFNLEQLYSDEHIKNREILQELEHPVLGKVKVIGVPWKLSEKRPPVYRAPLLGEDNTYVFHKMIGLSHDEIQQLQADKVIY